MNKYAPSPSPFNLDAELAEWLAREHRSIEDAIDSVHTLNILSTDQPKPQIGDMRYFSDDASMLWGEGPYCYMNVQGYTLWFPMFKPQLNKVISTAPPASMPITLTVGWQTIHTETIDIRMLHHLCVKFMADAITTSSSIYSSSAQYRVRVNGVAITEDYQPNWNIITNYAFSKLYLTTTFFGSEPPYLPGVGAPDTLNVTVDVQAKSLVASQVAVETCLIELEEKR